MPFTPTSEWQEISPEDEPLPPGLEIHISLDGSGRRKARLYSVPERKDGHESDDTSTESPIAEALDLFSEIQEALMIGDHARTEGVAEYLRYRLAGGDNDEQAESVSALQTRLALSDPKYRSALHELVGVPLPPSTQPEAGDLQENLLAECLQAATVATGTRQDELIETAFNNLSTLTTLAAERWQPEFARLLGMKRRVFDQLLKDARQRKADLATSQEETPQRAGTPTDDELGDRWLKAQPFTAYGLGEFRRYADGVWPVVPLDTIRAEISTVLKAAKPKGIRPSARLLGSVQELARVKISMPDATWDADPDILICKNGALHLPTRELRAHDSKHYATSSVPYAYDSYADAPMWDYLFRTTVPNAQDFLQEYAGYCLTPDTSFEIAVWLCGPRGSGRSTFITGLQAMLVAHAGLLGLADIERNRFALIDLPGKTLVVATEQPALYMTSTHILNAIISGEPITIERKYTNAVTITPHAKLIWAMNELPRVGNAGNGLFRRVKVVRFPPLATTPNPEVKKVIATEGAGILNWALVGLDRLRARGRFEIPPCVEDTTEKFQKTNDVPAEFVVEICNTGPNCKEQSGPLYTRYHDWCIATGHKPQSSTSMAAEWERLGFERYRADGKAFWRGVELAEVKVSLDDLIK